MSNFGDNVGNKSHVSSNADPAIRGFSSPTSQLFSVVLYGRPEVKDTAGEIPVCRHSVLVVLKAAAPHPPGDDSRGFEPALLQTMSTGFSADIGRGPPSIFTRWVELE
ncbi:hypothetical protein CEXT_809711 [Caerostris extrusa]|uniref:Uncharacterized protein n=1 Tax=Caerostris extrusa TaxID=172846 RepID=A0AAV4MBV9_CAEEX|nr:hypothetical protein CEXT_809711 [Caerostris extrusa]